MADRWKQGRSRWGGTEVPGLGDVRFDEPYARFTHASDRALALSRLTDEEVVEALAAASRANDPLAANVLATEATNRMRRLRLSLASLGEAVVTLGVDGKVRWANPAAEVLFSMRREAIIGRTLPDLLAPDSAETARMLCEGHGTSGDVELVRHDGRAFSAAYTCARIAAPDGSHGGVVVTLADATQRRRHERALRESEQRFRALFAHFPDAIFTVGADGTLLDANTAAEQLLHLPRSRIVGQPFAFMLAADDIARANETFARITLGAVERVDLRLVRGDGTLAAIEAFGIPVVVDGEVVGIHGIARERGAPQTS